MYFIMLSTALTLHRQGITNVHLGAGGRARAWPAVFARDFSRSASSAQGARNTPLTGSAYALAETFRGIRGSAVPSKARAVSW
jgi:hypothetical protein